MAKPELGTKRICPETGRKFFDLNKDPIVSPYTGHSYPRNFFDSSLETVVEEEEELEQKPLDDEAAEMIPVSDSDDGDVSDDEIPDLDDDEDVDLGDDDDTFLEEEEEDADDMSGIISVNEEDDER